MTKELWTLKLLIFRWKFHGHWKDINSEALPQTDKWLCALNSRLEEIQADAGCSILDINDINPYFIQHPETSIRHRFVYGLKAILKLVSFVKFLPFLND